MSQIKTVQARRAQLKDWGLEKRESEFQALRGAEVGIDFQERCQHAQGHGSGGWACSDPQKSSQKDLSRILRESVEPDTSPVLRGPRYSQDSQRPKMSHPYPCPPNQE